MNANTSGKPGLPAIWDTPYRCDRLVNDRTRTDPDGTPVDTPVDRIVVEPVFTSALVLPTLAQLTSVRASNSEGDTAVYIEKLRVIGNRVGYHELGRLTGDVGNDAAASVLAAFGSPARLSSRGFDSRAVRGGPWVISLDDPVPDEILRDFVAAGGAASLGNWAQPFLLKFTLELSRAATHRERFPTGLDRYAAELHNFAAQVAVAQGRRFRELRQLHVIRGRTRRMIWGWAADSLLERTAIEALELATVRPPLAICETCDRPFIQRRGKRHCDGHLWSSATPGLPLANCALNPARPGRKTRTRHETEVDTALRRVKRLKAKLETVDDPDERRHLTALIDHWADEHEKLKAKRGPKPRRATIRPA